MTNDEIIESIKAICTPLPESRELRDKIIIALKEKFDQENDDIFSGVFEHLRHPGNFYLALGLAREHHTGIEHIVYIPLRVEPEWSGTARMALRTVKDFHENFKYVGERLL